MLSTLKKVLGPPHAQSSRLRRTRRLRLQPLEDRRLLTLTGLAGGGEAHDNLGPSLAINYLIATSGVFPSRDGSDPAIGTMIGEIRQFAGNFAPSGYELTEGQTLPITSNTSALFSLLGTTYGGDGRNDFGIPDLRGRAVVGSGSGPGLSPRPLGQQGGTDSVQPNESQMPAHEHPIASDTTTETGGGQAHSNMQPFNTINYIVATSGAFCEVDNLGLSALPCLGEVRMFAGNFAPSGYQLASGQLLPISENDALFSILGTAYGGDGQTTFALPDLRGRISFGSGVGPGLSSRSVGARGGAEAVTLTTAQIPSHSHPLSDGATGNTGGGSSHPNVQPFTTLNFVTALTGVFPNRGGGSPADDPMIGEVRMFAGNFAPRGSALSQGQTLSIESSQALFSLLGTTYGGDGRQDFGLPDLRGRTPIHASSELPIGTSPGTENVTLNLAQLPIHVHDLPSLEVMNLTPTTSGFVAEFTTDLDASSLNLYDTPLAGMGVPDVVLDGPNGPVAGSLLVDSSLRSVTFIKTGDVLAPGTYSVTLRSGEDGFKSAAGELLDGDGDGTAGDDYSATIEVAVRDDNTITVSVGDFVRGPQQDVHLPADTGDGIPLNLSNGDQVRTVDLQISYDPAMLALAGVTLGPNMPAGASVSLNTDTPGLAIVQFTSPTALPSGTATIANLLASVPDNDPSGIYGHLQILDLLGVTIRDGADNQLPTVADDAVQLASFFGDASGNGRINAADASQVASFAALLQTGFAASLLIDPILVGDISGNGRLNALDASLLARFAALLPVPEIPPVPAGILVTGAPSVTGPGLQGPSALAPDKSPPNAATAGPATGGVRLSDQTRPVPDVPHWPVDGVWSRWERQWSQPFDEELLPPLEDAIEELTIADPELLRD